MPLVDDDVKGTGFDLSSSQTIYWKPVQVQLRQSDREDQTEELTFRILTGFAKQNHNLRILRIHISNDDDLCFLHSLEVSEEDFQQLKNEQGILVDFASFPSKIITLLDRCATPSPTDVTRFQAVLTVRGAESIFRIVEINDFKQLPHITLMFRPGNDSSVKQFLAFRLLEVRENCTDLTNELQGTKADKESLQTQLSSCQQQLTEVKEEFSRHMLEAQAEFKTQRAVAQEEGLHEREALKEQHEKEKQDLERRFREQNDILSSRASELDAENRKLREQKYDLDSRVSELSHKLGSAEGSKRSLEEESSRLKQQNQLLSSEKHEREIQLNEARAKLTALDEKAQAQVEIIDQQRSRVRELESAARQAEGRCEDLKEACSGHELRAKEAQGELVKANQVIEKIMNDFKLSKEKLRRKQAIIVRQEEELQAREAALASALKELQVLTQAIETLRADRGLVTAENAELRSKVDESRQQLQSNEQMIRWLNQQVTDAQLQLTGTTQGSRYRAPPIPALASISYGSVTPSAGHSQRLLTGSNPVAPTTYASGYSTVNRYQSYQATSNTVSTPAPRDSSSYHGGDEMGSAGGAPPLAPAPQSAFFTS